MLARHTIIGLAATAVLLAYAVPFGPARAFHVQSAEDAAQFLARLSFLEDRCAKVVRGNRPGLTELVKTGGTRALRDAEWRALERLAARDGLGRLCAMLAEEPGLAVVETGSGP